MLMKIYIKKINQILKYQTLLEKLLILKIIKFLINLHRSIILLLIQELMVLFQLNKEQFLMMLYGKISKKDNLQMLDIITHFK